jgi:hypothetical protein
MVNYGRSREVKGSLTNNCFVHDSVNRYSRLLPISGGFVAGSAANGTTLETTRRAGLSLTRDTVLAKTHFAALPRSLILIPSHSTSSRGQTHPKYPLVAAGKLR